MKMGLFRKSWWCQELPIEKNWRKKDKPKVSTTTGSAILLMERYADWLIEEASLIVEKDLFRQERVKVEKLPSPYDEDSSLKDYSLFRLLTITMHSALSKQLCTYNRPLPKLQ